MDLYLLFKALHVISVIFWMAGMLYLPRLFVYHASRVENQQINELFKLMEKRLLRIIINPAMIASIVFGAGLIHFVGFDAGIWLHVKLLLVLVLFGYHGFLVGSVKNFANDTNKRSEKFYRMINEIPAFLIIFIVLLVILKPF